MLINTNAFAEATAFRALVHDECGILLALVVFRPAFAVFILVAASAVGSTDAARQRALFTHVRRICRK